MKIHVLGVQYMGFKDGEGKLKDNPMTADRDVLYTAPMDEFENDKFLINGIGHKMPMGKDGKGQSRVDTFKCPAALLPDFEKCHLPAWVEMELEGVLNQFGKMVSYVKSVKPWVEPAASRAAPAAVKAA